MAKQSNGSAAPKVSAPKKPLTTAHIIKVAACAVIFLVAMVLFSIVCRQVTNDYLMILLPKIDTIVSWLIRLSVCTLFLALMIGIIIVLERPFWLDAVLFFLAAVIFVFVLGTETAVWIAAVVFFLFLLLHSSLAVKQFKNQINFSVHPLSDRNLIFFSVLTMLVAVAFGIGVSKDMTRHNYVIAPEINEIAVSYLVSQVQGKITSQRLTPAKEKEALNAIHESAQAFVNDNVAKPLTPYADKIPLALAAVVFLVLEILFVLLSFIYLLLVRALIGIFRVTHFAMIEMETREVKHLAI